jgi:hypothetical protein
MLAPQHAKHVALGGGAGPWAATLVQGYSLPGLVEHNDIHKKYK